MAKLFVWDFHGTLEKGSEEGVRYLLNTILREKNYTQRFTVGDAQRLAGKKPSEHFADLLPDEPAERHLELQQQWYAAFDTDPMAVIRFVKPNDHAHDVLAQVGSKYQQILISNVRSDSLSRYVEQVQMLPYFSSDALFGIVREPKMTKEEALCEFLSQHPDYDSLVCVGDSVADVGLVSVLKGSSYLYAHEGRPFRDCEATYKINDLREVLREI